MNSEQVLLINAILYLMTLVFFIRKYKMSVGVVIWALYTISAWGSLFFIKNPFYQISIHSSKQTFFPCIYLYVVFLISMLPLMKLTEINEIEIQNKKLLTFIIIFLSISYTLFFLMDITSMLRIISAGSNVLGKLRNNAYTGESYSNVLDNVWTNRLHLLLSGLRILSTGLSVILLCNKESSKLCKVYFITTLLNNIRYIIVNIGRGEIVMLGMLYSITFYLMWDKLSQKTKRMILSRAIPLAAISIIAFWTITVSRFGNSRNGIGYYILKYIGEPINNFNGLLFNNIKGSTHGQAYFSIFYTYLLGGRNFRSVSEKWNLIFNTTGVRGDIFYTWVGGVIIEFGKVCPFIFAIIFNRITSRMVAIKRYYSGDLVLLVFFLNFYLRGIFMFPTQNFEGVGMILYSLLLYVIFRLNVKHGHVLFKLPTKSFFKMNTR